jgi:hypothetical protein
MSIRTVIADMSIDRYKYHLAANGGHILPAEAAALEDVEIVLGRLRDEARDAVMGAGFDHILDEKERGG